MKLFLDTNVFIDFILERRPFYDPAAMLISYGFQDKIDLQISSLTMVNASYICKERCKMPDNDYRKKIDFIRKFVSICSVESNDVFPSYDAKWKDFEDGVQYFSAQRNETDYIITRNGKDFQENNIPVITPLEACELVSGDKQ